MAGLPRSPGARRRLRRSDCGAPGIIRRRHGRGFGYLDPNGRRITDPDLLGRIAALRIPPAWRDVWICPDPYGHLQAVGTDAAGRRQYLYHDRWRARRDQEKFDRMLAFGHALPRLRERATADLTRPGVDRARALAGAVRLLDRGFFRAGGEEYAREHGTFGVATIERRHVRVHRGGSIDFDYPAKGGQRRVLTVRDAELAPLVRTLLRRRGGGADLFAYRDHESWVDVRSEDLNLYLKAAAGGEFTAKDFRTWNATVLASVALAVSGVAASSPTGRARAIRRAIVEVAHYLGNTPAVCRRSYIDPRVFDRYRAGVTIAGALDELGAVGPEELPVQTGIEAAVLDLIEERPSGAVAEGSGELTELAG